MLAVVDIIW